MEKKRCQMNESDKTASEMYLEWEKEIIGEIVRKENKKVSNAKKE